VIELLQEMGIKVFQLKNMHQKIAVIDRKITWEGSLNILSHQTSHEHMRRFEGAKTAEQIINYYQLDKDFCPGMQHDNLCPVCAQKGIKVKLQVREGKYGSFLSCPNYPLCKYKKNINKKTKCS